LNFSKFVLIFIRTSLLMTVLFEPKKSFALTCLTSVALVLSACADTVGPEARTPVVPAPKAADERQKAINETADSVIYLPLGEDVLMPKSTGSEVLPDTIVGPFELRGETLAGALQLILDGLNIPVAFESSSSLTETITVTNLKGPLNHIVNEVCSLANMYCSYNKGILSVKDREIFTVTIPPIVASAEVAPLLTNISAAIGNITGEAPISDPSTRTIVYRASQRTAEMATRYFQRLRANTAMVVYETYIWEVALDANNAAGIRWTQIGEAGKYEFGLSLSSLANPNLGSPISIGLPTSRRMNFSTGDILEFISTYGAVKTISQPQVSVLSGSTARLRVSDRQNYVASISRTTTDIGETVSTTTSSVDTGFTLEIGSNWDNSSIYGNISILLQEVKEIETFDENENAIVQLPQTTERELTTSVRVRPGDTILIAGLVRESDRINREGPGLAEPILPTSRSAQSSNTELVFLLRPKVIIFTAPDASTPRQGSLPQLANIDSNLVGAPMPTMIDSAPKVQAIKEDIAVEPLTPELNQTPSPITEELAKPSLEIQPLSSVVTPQTSQEKGNPSVIVNYEVLGR
jgi:hypothetical protein